MSANKTIYVTESTRNKINSIAKIKGIKPGKLIEAWLKKHEKEELTKNNKLIRH